METDMSGAKVSGLCRMAYVKDIFINIETGSFMLRKTQDEHTNVIFVKRK